MSENEQFVEKTAKLTVQLNGWVAMREAFNMAGAIALARIAGGIVGVLSSNEDHMLDGVRMLCETILESAKVGRGE